MSKIFIVNRYCYDGDDDSGISVVSIWDDRKNAEEEVARLESENKAIKDIPDPLAGRNVYDKAIPPQIQTLYWDWTYRNARARETNFSLEEFNLNEPHKMDILDG